ncbi:uncharacterized membrane protein (DUF485 family) [Pedobacter sp. UYP30]
MLSFESFKQKSPIQRFLLILSLLMFIFFVVIGFMFIFWKGLNLGTIQAYRVPIGIFFILYGFLRMWSLNRKSNT